MWIRISSDECINLTHGVRVKLYTDCLKPRLLMWIDDGTMLTLYKEDGYEIEQIWFNIIRRINN